MTDKKAEWTKEFAGMVEDMDGDMLEALSEAVRHKMGDPAERQRAAKLAELEGQLANVNALPPGVRQVTKISLARQIAQLKNQK